MRISYWSSDVCSSDLMVLAPVIGLQARKMHMHGAPARLMAVQPMHVVEQQAFLGRDPLGGAGIGHVAPLTPLSGRSHGDAAFLGLLLHQQIGRASCRERVCQYV